ncbi:MAG: GatB/YqeY domain-containing protein [Zetaproteobacteria bacterium]|nr:MAG: GatB/YqeY domain-containing protein [Zetaproteobacteria bacterium]
MLIERITEDMKLAMKAGDKARVAAIRMLRAAIKDREIELGHALDDDEAEAVLARLLKQRKEAAAQYAEGGREDLAAAERAEAELIQSYLPEPLGEQELRALIEAIVEEVGASGLRDMGKVMGALKARAGARVDMGRASAMVKAVLG